jgi:hypothetical protein
VGGDGMDGRAEALASYLVGLAILEQTGNTYVQREIRAVLEEIQKELKLKK